MRQHVPKFYQMLTLSKKTTTWLHPGTSPSTQDNIFTPATGSEEYKNDILHYLDRIGFINIEKCLWRPFGTLVEENFHAELKKWFFYQQDHGVYWIEDVFEESYSFIKNTLNIHDLPLGLLKLKNFHSFRENSVLVSYLLVSSDKSLDAYSNWQKKRRAWWRRVSFY